MWGGAVAGFLAFLAVQIQQRTLRWRAERLSAEMHQVRLYQSTWADAQRLMYRWGRWGHYDGSCTAASCKYEIEMDSVDRYTPRIPRHVWLDWLLQHDRLNLYQWFGGRLSAFHASFTVHDGTIWKEKVPRWASAYPAGGYEQEMTMISTGPSLLVPRVTRDFENSVLWTNPRMNLPNIRTTK